MTMTEVAPGTRARTATQLRALFVVYLALLVWVVLWKLEAPWDAEPGGRIVKLVPFVATSGAGASTPFDVVANLLLFLPFGLYLGLLAPAWRWWKVAGAAATVSVALELMQYVLAVGSSDLTDVVVNTAGAVTGLGLLAVTRRRLRTRTATVMTRACAIGTVLAVLASVVVVASPLRYGPPRDVRCTTIAGSVRCGPPGELTRPGG